MYCLEEILCFMRCWAVILRGFRLFFIQKVLDNFDDIVVTVGSGGTASGIAIANYLTGSKLK